MTIFRATEGSYRRVIYGAAVTAGLLHDPVTSHLAPEIGDPTRRLREAMSKRQDAEIERACASAECGLAEVSLEATLRALQKTVGAQTLTTRGALERDLFPGGLVPAILPRRDEQLAAAVEVLQRLKESASEGAEAVRASFLTSLQAAIDAFRSKLSLWRAATELLDELRRAEKRARGVHSRALLVVDADLRRLFPEDKARRRAFLPKPPRRARKSAPQEDEDLDEADEMDGELPLAPAIRPPRADDAA